MKRASKFLPSSITIKDFKYEPTQKTKKKEIWQYLNSANLIN